jgi:predicted membrane protein
LGDLAIGGLFFALSLIVGLFVVTALMVIASPVVAIFPADSGAQEIVLGISLMWGVVAGCVVAVFTIGSYRRMHARAQIEAIDATESMPLEMIGRPIARRGAANDRRARAKAPAYIVEDDEDELLLEEEEMPRRRAAGGRRARRA